MKKLIRLVLAIVVVFLVVKYCSDKYGNVINLPGGLGGNETEESGGWFTPKDKGNKETTEKTVPKDISDLEKELGIGEDNSPSTTINIPSTTTATAPLTFKGIPITGTLSAFSDKLVKAGFKKNGNSSFTGDFAGYSGCRITVVGNNPVNEVRVDFPVISDWDALEKAYDSLQASLTQKYGIEPKTSSGSNVATYDLPNGTITLDADVRDKASWHVILIYANEVPTLTGRNPIDDL